jgi:2-polyprenyl-3-methyl-5-hydroxy-6-metoxy-1,4-benzoquinol methylase
VNQIEALQSALNNLLPDTELNVLDAGCGHESYLDFGGKARITGIDISEANLAKHRHLSCRLTGDLQTFQLPSRQFDAVVCWDVLEHLANPTAALENMVQSLKPSGLLILVFPNVYSLKGIVTKFTPLWFHRFIYRTLYRIDNPDFQPYPTYLKLAMSPKSVLRFARSRGLTVEYSGMFKSALLEKIASEHPIIAIGIRGVRLLGRVVGIDPDLSECALVLRYDVCKRVAA